MIYEYGDLFICSPFFFLAKYIRQCIINTRNTYPWPTFIFSWAKQKQTSIGTQLLLDRIFKV